MTNSSSGSKPAIANGTKPVIADNKPIGVEYIAGNAGTFDGMDPSVRVYTMHSQEHIPLDFTVYRFDIEESNTRNTPVMKTYSNFREDFDMEDLSPSSHLKLSESFLTDKEVAQKFQYFKYKDPMFNVHPHHEPEKVKERIKKVLT